MRTFIFILLIVVLGIAGYIFLSSGDSTEIDPEEEETETNEENGENEEDSEEEGEDQEDTQTNRASETIIGTSVDGNDITAHHYGEGNDELLFVGGIHGGYSWGTALVAYELVDYLEDNPDALPENLSVTVVPVLNPDGLEEVVGSTGRFTQADVPQSQEATIPGRFNANEVDLNRNFDCDWESTAMWQQTEVDGGSAPFSEPESQAIRDYVEQSGPEAVVVWYSAAGGVFASNCHNGVLPETTEITNAYADASGYPAYESFDFYSITGDMVNWLAKEEIPAISVLLSAHGQVEWSQNRDGIEALFEYYAQ